MNNNNDSTAPPDGQNSLHEGNYPSIASIGSLKKKKTKKKKTEAATLYESIGLRISSVRLPIWNGTPPDSRTIAMISSQLSALSRDMRVVEWALGTDNVSMPTRTGADASTEERPSNRKRKKKKTEPRKRKRKQPASPTEKQDDAAENAGASDKKKKKKRSMITFATHNFKCALCGALETPQRRTVKGMTGESLVVCNKCYMSAKRKERKAAKEKQRAEENSSSE